MIKNLSMQRGATFFKLQWPAPRFSPIFYYQITSCSLWYKRISYLHFDKVIEPNATSILVESIKPGSKCAIRFRAVYNLASLDEGITMIASTPFGGNDKNAQPVHIPRKICS